MKLTVLGKYGPYPPAGGATSGYLLEEGETRVLVECGSGVLSRLQRFVPIERLDAIVLSHLHSDHTADLFILRYALQNAKMQLRVLLPPNPAEEFDRIAGCPPFAAEKIQEGAAVNIGAFSFVFVPMTHPFVSFGMRVTDGRHTLVYTGDSNWNSRAVSFARGCDLLLADTGLPNSAKQDPKAFVPHFTAGEVGALAAQAGVPRLLCSHLPPSVPESSILEEVRQNYLGAELAQELKTYEL